ncbi:MAG: hypothetical protein EA374_00365, partial [Acholeplasmatales bacterium]
HGPVRVRNHITTIIGLYRGTAWYHLFRDERLLVAQDGLTDVQITHPENWWGTLCLEAHDASSCVFVESMEFYHLTTHSGQLHYVSSPDNLLTIHGRITLDVTRLHFDRLTFSTYLLNDLSHLYLLGIACLFVPLIKKQPKREPH